MGENHKKILKNILAALAVVTVVVTSKKTGWHRPGELYALRCTAGADATATANEWIRLDGHHWMEPNIKWIKKSEPSQYR